MGCKDMRVGQSLVLTEEHEGGGHPFQIHQHLHSTEDSTKIYSVLAEIHLFPSASDQ